MTNAEHIATALLDSDETAKQFIHRGAHRWHPIWRITNAEIRQLMRTLGFKVKALYRSKQQWTRMHGAIVITAIPMEGIPVDPESRKQWAHDVQAIVQSELGNVIDSYVYLENDGTLRLSLHPASLDQANINSMLYTKKGQSYTLFPDRLVSIEKGMHDREKREFEKRERDRPRPRGWNAV